MYNQITQFVEDKKILYYKQFGFRKNFSTIHAITSLIENVQSAFENSKFASWGFFNLEKEFDTVNQNILLIVIYN